MNLDDLEEVVSEAYHQEGAGRPPRKPLGIFKALIVKRVKQIPSDRELYRRLWYDQDLREVCDIEAEQKPYHPTQMTRFRNRIGVARLERIMGGLVDELLKGGLIIGKIVVLDATFIKAYSKRDIHENSRGGSDPQARVGRNGKTYELANPTGPRARSLVGLARLEPSSAIRRSRCHSRHIDRRGPPARYVGEACLTARKTHPGCRYHFAQRSPQIRL